MLMKMQYRILGKTGLKVSEIGFGGIPIQKIDEKKSVSIIRHAGKQGINFIDTGRAYTDSERKIGIALKNQRDRWIVATKSPSVSYEDMKCDIKKSFSELKMKYIDLYQLHHVKSIKMLKAAMEGAYRAIKEFQKKGKIGFVGITSHEPEVLKYAVKTRKFESVMTSFNYYERESLKLIRLCKKKNIGVIVMKPLAGGLVKNPGSAMRYCLSVGGVSTVIPGIHTKKELKEDVIDVLKSRKFTTQDKKKMEKDEIKHIRDGKYCRGCGYCVTVGPGCPRDINIFYFLALEGYFEKFGKKPEAKKWIINAYKKQAVKPGACIYCGHCEIVCPYGLPIMRILRDMKVRKQIEKSGEEQTNKFGKRDWHAEKRHLDETAKKNLGKRWVPPIVYFKYKRCSNPGQKETVFKLIKEFEKFSTPRQRQDAINKLCREMKIENKCITSLHDLAMLSDYNNIVDMMRMLPIMIKQAKKKK